MKKYLLAAVLVLASTSAMADRTVGGMTQASNFAAGINSYDSKASACDSAKKDANSKAQSKENVVEYSKCECEKEANRWICSVDAKLEKH